MTHAEALEKVATRWWEVATPQEIATFQLREDRLCCPFDVFQLAVESTLGRPVFTHEFGMNRDGLLNELAAKGF